MILSARSFRLDVLPVGSMLMDVGAAGLDLLIALSARKIDMRLSARLVLSVRGLCEAWRVRRRQKAKPKTRQRPHNHQALDR